MRHVEESYWTNTIGREIARATEKSRREEIPAIPGAALVMLGLLAGLLLFAMAANAKEPVKTGTSKTYFTIITDPAYPIILLQENNEVSYDEAVLRAYAEKCFKDSKEKYDQICIITRLVVAVIDKERARKK